MPEPAGGLTSLWSMQPAELREASVLKVIGLLNAICNYSIEQENLRGETVESIQKKIHYAKQRKQRQKAMLNGNTDRQTNTANQAADEDDDGDSEDKKQYLSIIKDFKEQAIVLQQLFDFIEETLRLDSDVPHTMLKYSGLDDLLERGMVLSENW